MQNIQAMPGELSKQCHAVQVATGEKYVMIYNSFAMSIAGFAYAFLLGWKFGFVCLGMFPATIVTVTFLTIILQRGYKASYLAFKKSAAQAEQAISAIKVVAACVQEEKEIRNFESHLMEARKAGIKTHFCSGVGYAMNNAIFLLCTSYAMYIGALFVDKEIKKSDGTIYTAGDT